MLISANTVWAQVSAGEVQIAPAEFSFYINPPGTSERLIRPTAIYFDRHFGELYVADQGQNRISIFDPEGRYKYEFTGGSYFSSPIDLAVDSEGFIYVLGSTRDGRYLFRFDFDGLLDTTLAIPKMYQDTSVTVASFDLSGEGELFLYDQDMQRILVMDQAGHITRSFAILTDYSGRERVEQVVGKIRVRGDHLLVVSGSAGSAYVYDLQGHLERRVGQKGGERGQLAFPSAAVMTDNGTVIILDRISHNYVVFDSLGRPLAEIGGRGNSPGWFYQPTLLEIENQNRIIIGQIFENRVQACLLPPLDVFAGPGSKTTVRHGDLGQPNHPRELSSNVFDISNNKRASDAPVHLNALSNTRIPRRYF